MKARMAAGGLGLSQSTIVATVLVILGLFAQEAVAICERRGQNRDWKYTLGDLQEARQRITRPETPSGKVKCAKTIIRRLGPGPFRACHGCPREYASLLTDSAYIMRLASERRRISEEIKNGYLAGEAEVHQRLEGFLLRSQQDGIRDEFFNDNLLRLADVLELLKQADKYHKIVTALSQDHSKPFKKLDSRIFQAWIKSVRSCPGWDFRGSNDDLAALRKTLCREECIEAFKAIYTGLKAADRLAPNGKVKSPLSLLPNPADCETQQR